MVRTDLHVAAGVFGSSKRTNRQKVRELQKVRFQLTNNKKSHFFNLVETEKSSHPVARGAFYFCLYTLPIFWGNTIFVF